MVAFDLNIDLYFWMIDRGNLTDDQRNIVLIEEQMVKLHRDHATRIENAIYIGRLMHSIRKSIIKKTKKPFTLDPQLLNMRDLSSVAIKSYNWNLVILELKKFRIMIDKTKKELIIGGRQSLIHDVIQQLYIFDRNLETLDTKKSRKSPQMVQPHSELNYGPVENTVERQYERPQIDSQNLSQHGDVKQLGLKASPTSQIQLNKHSLIDLDSQAGNNNYQLLNLQFDNLIGNAVDETIEVQSNASSAYPNGAYEGQRLGLSDSKSSLDFILESLSQALGMNQSQAAALLANNQKYLIHLCIKGMKGKDFSRVLGWYKLISQGHQKLVHLIESEKYDNKVLSMTFDVVKCGLFSKNIEVVELCSRTLNKLSSYIQDRSEKGRTSLEPLMWEWLTTSTTATSPKKKVIHASKKNELQALEVESLISESGLKTMIKAFFRHESDFVETFCSMMLRFGKGNYVELFMKHLRSQADSNKDYMVIIQEVLACLLTTIKGQRAIMETGVLSMIIEMCLEIGDLNQTASITVEERQLSLTILADIWKAKPDFIQSGIHQGVLSDAIITILKRGCRDGRSKAISITSINLMFYLLENFARDRNAYAPTMYKALTFLLIECYLIMDLREEIQKKFVTLFKNIQNIPIAIMCEPLLKQIQINIQKQEFLEKNNLDQRMLQPTSDHFSLNITDFELFMTISLHPKLTITIATQLLEIVCEISRKNIIFTRSSLKVLITLLQRFENNTKIYETLQKTIKDQFNILTEQDKTKVEMYLELKDNPKAKIMARKKSVNVESNSYAYSTINKKNQAVNFKSKKQSNSPVIGKTLKVLELNYGEKIDDSHLSNMLNPTHSQMELSQYLGIKTTERLIINQLQCLTQIGIKVLTDFVRNQALETYMKIEQKYKFVNKGLLYLLNLFEKDVQKLLAFSRQKTIKEKRSSIMQKKLTKKRQSQVSPEHGNPNDSFDFMDESTSLLKNAKHSIATESINQRQSTYSPKAGRRNLNKNMSMLENKLSSPKRMQRNFRVGRTQARGSVSRSPSNSQSKTRKMVTYKPPANSVKLFDISVAQESEQAKYVYWIKDKLKLYRTMFKKYATGSMPRNNSTFDDVTIHKSFMSLAAVNTFLADFKITKQDFVKREDAKKIVQLINLRQHNNTRSSSDLDLEGFIEFVLQLGYFMYRDQTQMPSKFLVLLFDRLKQTSLNSRQPLFQRHFQDPADELQNDEQLHYLNELINADPSYSLPPGYTKVKVDKIQEVYQADFRQYPRESQQIAIGILDDLFDNLFGVHLIEPMIINAKQWVVKPEPLIQTIKKPKEARYLQIYDRYQFQGNQDPKNRRNNIGLSFQSGSTADDRLKNNKASLSSLTEDTEGGRAGTRGVSVDPVIHEKVRMPPINASKLRQKYNQQSAQEYSTSIGQSRSTKSINKASINIRPINRLMESKIEEQERKRREEMMKEDRIKKRHTLLKKQLEDYKEIKRYKELESEAQKLDQIAQLRSKEKSKQEGKKKFYAQLKQQHDQEKLPQIQQNKQIEKEIQLKEKQEKKIRKMEAQKRIDANTQKLSEKFKEMAMRREEQQQSLMIQEKKEKRKEELVRQKTMQIANTKSKRKLSPGPAQNPSYMSPTAASKNSARFQSMNIQEEGAASNSRSPPPKKFKF